MSVTPSDKPTHPHKTEINVAKAALNQVVATKSTVELVSLASRVREWYNNGGQDTFFIGPITLNDLLALDSILIDNHVKLRSEWSKDTFVARLHMTTPLHEAPGIWLSQLQAVITAWLKSIAICGDPYAEVRGASRTTIAPAVRLPDQTLYLCFEEDKIQQGAKIPNQDKKGGGILQRMILPRVVLETAYSQSRADAIAKAWTYLHLSDYAIHAVIIVSMTYPVPPEGQFRGEIGVWVRQETRDVEKDYPLERCVYSSVSDHQEPGMEGGATDDGDDSNELANDSSKGPLSSPSEHTWRSDASTLTSSGLLPETYRPPNENGNESKNHKPFIKQRSNIVFIDEASSTPSTDRLSLDPYDFLRPCDKRPNTYMHASSLEVNLDDLRDRVTRLVHNERQLQVEEPAPAVKVHAPRGYPDKVSKRRAEEVQGRPKIRVRRDT